jgi:drug/metabolite transporter (DMT)-like permease
MFLLPALRLAPAVRGGGAPDEAAARLIGPGSMASYLLMLFAYRVGPLGYLIAAREIAVAFGAALGYFILKEKVTPRRLLGVALVVAGLALIKALG